jgi:hypothetical protein
MQVTAAFRPKASIRKSLLTGEAARLELLMRSAARESISGKRDI